MARRAQYLVGCLSLSVITGGCACPASSNAPIKIEIPGEASNMMTTGFPMGELDRTVFMNISPTTPILVAQEWLQAPSMTMVHLPSGMTGDVNSVFAPFLQNALPPLERDVAFCGSQPGNDEVPMETAATYPVPTVITGLDFYSALAGILGYPDLEPAFLGTPT